MESLYTGWLYSHLTWTAWWLHLSDAASPRLVLVCAEEVESICLLVRQTVLDGVLRCETERERDAGWTGRVRADCLSVMNINGLQVTVFSSSLPV